MDLKFLVSKPAIAGVTSKALASYICLQDRFSAWRATSEARSRSCQWRVRIVRPKQRGMTQLRLTLTVGLLVGVGRNAALTSAVSSAARAQDASDWMTQLHTAARLIAGDTAKTAAAPVIRAGIEIKLDPGWHTYWRDPGDTGVPPTFDFSGSANLKSATVEWPAPESFSDGAGGTSIGYVDHVILPLRVTPQDPEKQLRPACEARLCGVRQFVHPRRSQFAACARRQRRRERGDPSGGSPRAAPCGGRPE